MIELQQPEKRLLLRPTLPERVAILVLPTCLGLWIAIGEGRGRAVSDLVHGVQFHVLFWPAFCGGIYAFLSWDRRNFLRAAYVLFPPITALMFSIGLHNYIREDGAYFRELLEPGPWAALALLLASLWSAYKMTFYVRRCLRG